MIQKVLDAIHQAHYVYVAMGPDGNIQGGRLYVWHGGPLVNIYSLWTGANIDCFTIDNVESTTRDIHQEIKEYIALTDPS